MLATDFMGDPPYPARGNAAARRLRPNKTGSDPLSRCAAFNINLWQVQPVANEGGALQDVEWERPFLEEAYVRSWPD
jgi:hypothetical protein